MVEPRIISTGNEKQQQVIYEDEEILVLDKPAGVTVNRAETTKGERTVQDWLEANLQIRSTKSEILNNSNIQNGFEFRDSNFEFIRRAGIVHRLDKETSGVLIVAKTPKSFEDLQRQFKERTVRKTYIALVHGQVKPQEGEIVIPVGRLPWNRKRFGIIAGGRTSSTTYKVIANYTLPFGPAQGSPRGFTPRGENATLLELHPTTGRTHQIRVHLKYLGHPIVADLLYGGRKQARSDRKLLSRFFLHAKGISFTHPKTKESVFFSSPMPSELQSFLTLCREQP